MQYSPLVLAQPLWPLNSCPAFLLLLSSGRGPPVHVHAAGEPASDPHSCSSPLHPPLSGLRDTIRKVGPSHRAGHKYGQSVILHCIVTVVL